MEQLTDVHRHHDLGLRRIGQQVACILRRDTGVDERAVCIVDDIGDMLEQTEMPGWAAWKLAMEAGMMNSGLSLKAT